MKKFVTTTLVATAVVISAGTASALTIKQGQVLGGDGKVYDGASPEQQANIIANSKAKGLFGQTGKAAGVIGSNLYVVVADDIVFIPVSEIRGKDKDEIKDVVVEYVQGYFLEQAADGVLNLSDGSVIVGGVFDDEIDATKEEIASSLDSLNLDETARTVTEQAWQGISGADLEAATAYAAERIAEDARIEELIESGEMTPEDCAASPSCEWEGPTE